MGILRFPHLGIVRVAIGRGIVPSEWSERAVGWAVDQEGRVWLQLHAVPPHNVLENLAHLGVSWQRELPPLRFSRSRCWAAILPLERCQEAPDPKMVLVCLPAAQIGELARSHFFFGSGFRIIHTDFVSRTVWGLLSPVSAPNIELWQFKIGLRAYVEQAQKRWVEWGYRHPLIEHIHAPWQGIYVIDTSGKVRRLQIASDLFSSMPDILREPKCVAMIPPAALRVQSANHVIPLRLRWSATTEDRHDPTLWYIPSDIVPPFRQQCQQMDQGMLSRVEVACVQTGHARGWLIWDKSGSTALTFQLPAGATAYVADAEIPLLFWPQGWQWRPLLGAAERIRQTGTCNDAVTWVEKCSDGTCQCHRVAVENFRPISTLVEYVVPPLISMRVVHEESEEETLSWTVTDSDPRVSSEKRAPSAPTPRLLPSTRQRVAQPTQSTQSGMTFWQRIWTQIGEYLRVRLQANWKRWWGRAQNTDDQLSSPTISGGGSSSPGGGEAAAVPIPRRDGKLSEVASGGAEGTLRQSVLCQRLLNVEEAGSVIRREECWAELGRWQQSSGRFHDAALCWLMAAWESRRDIFPRWCEQWWLMELRLARVAAELVGDPAFWWERQEDVSRSRLAAALLVRWAVEGKAGAEVHRLLPSLLERVERHAGELPLRAVWLAVCAASQLCEGNTLLLARWVDRLMQRLSRHGHALDVDVPSFLRYADNPEPERLNAVCTWLIRQRHQMLGWVLRHPVGPLRVEGLDGETAVTGQIAFQMWTWGLAAAGERRRAEEWSNSPQVSCEGLDDETSAALRCVVAAIRWRRQELGDGRPAQPGWPTEWWVQRQSLSPIARYAVDRLCEYSRILDPFRLLRPLRCWELSPLRGDDSVGERLAVLLERTDVDGVTSEAEELLRLCEQSSDSQRTCRILIALCELAALFPAVILERMLKLVPVAWEALPAAWPDRGENLITRLTYLRQAEVQCRMLENLARAMVRWPEGLAGPFLAELWQQWQVYLPTVAPVMSGVIPLLAHVFRRFRLQRQLEELAEVCEHGLLLEGSRNWEYRLAAAIGWAALEESDRSDPILDAARDYLFLPAPDASELSAREYAQAAYGYAAALAFLSCRRRLGRYEELFQRLRPLPVHGSTNRFWTLQPLRLVDIVVQGAIGEIYRLSPQIQQWLASEDMRFRRRVFQDLQQRLHVEMEGKVSLDP